MSGETVARREPPGRSAIRPVNGPKITALEHDREHGHTVFAAQGNAEAETVALEEPALGETQVIGHEIAAELQPEEQHQTRRGKGPGKALARQEQRCVPLCAEGHHGDSKAKTYANQG